MAGALWLQCMYARSENEGVLAAPMGRRSSSIDILNHRLHLILHGMKREMLQSNRPRALS